jgi:hypothetical protein
VGAKIITRTWHLVDNCGNAAADQVQTITVLDNIAPTFTRPSDITIHTTANCSYDASVSATGDVTNEADNCSTGLQATFTDVAVNGSCPGSKIITRTWHLADNCGNAAVDQVQTITVTDNTAPTVTTQPVTITLVNGSASTTASGVNNGSTDNCTSQSNLQMSLSKTTFSCSDIGSNTVTLTVTDACGNTATGTATVTVVGSVPTCTIVSTPSSTVLTDGSPNHIYLGYGAQSATLTATGTGGSDFTYSWSPATYLSNPAIAAPVFTPTAAGTYTYTVTAKNANGCTVTASITMCVMDIRVPGSNNKIYLCHVPTGNTANTQALEVSVSSVNSHLLGHPGDHLGACDQVICTSSSTRTTPAERNEIAEEIFVYPTPNNGSFTLSMPYLGDAKAQVVITDVAGKTVQQRTITDADGNKIGFRLGDVARGMYFIEVTYGDHRFRTKLSVH